MSGLWLNTEFRIECWIDLFDQIHPLAKVKNQIEEQEYRTPVIAYKWNFCKRRNHEGEIVDK